MALPVFYCRSGVSPLFVFGLITWDSVVGGAVVVGRL